MRRPDRAGLELAALEMFSQVVQKHLMWASITWTGWFMLRDHKSDLLHLFQVWMWRAPFLKPLLPVWFIAFGTGRKFSFLLRPPGRRALVKGVRVDDKDMVNRVVLRLA